MKATLARPRVGPLALFLGFAELGLVSFGGAIAMARRLIVDKHDWLDLDEFNEIVGLAQVLPGPNVVNASVVIGQRHAGTAGALASLAGVLLPPLALVLVVAALLARFAADPWLRDALHGSALAGSGLIVATGLRMAARLRGNGLGIALAGAALGLLLLGVPLIWIIVLLVPAGVAGVIVRDRRAA